MAVCWPGGSCRPSYPRLHPTGNLLRTQDLNFATRACDSGCSSIVARRFASRVSQRGTSSAATVTGAKSTGRDFSAPLAQRKRMGLPPNTNGQVVSSVGQMPKTGVRLNPPPFSRLTTPPLLQPGD